MSRKNVLQKTLLILLLVLLAICPASQALAGVNIWTSQGPEGGLIFSLVIDPLTPDTLYAGTSEGGVFKSTDGGIYSLAIDPLEPSILYAGTYNGVFKSSNSGASWEAFNAGLTNPDVTSLAIDPLTPDNLFAGTHGGSVFAFQQKEYLVNLPLILR